MDLGFQLQKKTSRWILVVGLVALTHISFQFLFLPYGNALRSLLLRSLNSTYDESSSPIGPSLTKSAMVRNPLAVDLSGLKNYSILAGVARKKDADDSTGNGDIGEDPGQRESVEATENGVASKGRDLDKSVEVVLDRDIDNEFPSDDLIIDEDETQAIDEEERLALESVKTQQSDVGLALVSEAQHDLPFEQNLRTNHEIPMDGILGENLTLAHQEFEHVNIALKSPSEGSEAVGSVKNVTYLNLNGNSTVASAVSESHITNLKNKSSIKSNPGRKKMRCEMPPNSITSIEEMDSILWRHRRSSRSMRPRWSSARDQEILAARSEIENAPVVMNDQDLYAPLFRNVSKFKRSYELMEHILKIYVYKEGKKPVFHVPILKGLYASEGWFMKLMQGNKKFVVKDPRRAHLFYMPFSSRMLEYTIYVRNSHNRTNLRLYLKDYAEKIAAKYRYWNRTGGADHFLVACHDWAPYETRHHMEHCIKALCNADVTVGFKIGRDVSLPETYVRSARNPLRDLGGKPASQRHILAFYAGGMHGYLRPVLLEHWKDKDPNMKIFGPMPPGVASKMNYIQHMKSSKYCICPRGYEVNSPRVVESIFYECVPVIISDNFVPPFFEVLDWRAFSVILPEKDIPKLREILLSIPEEKYLDLQLGVKKVQRHFLWHVKPMKYDLFNMILHSIWYNRVYQIKPR